ncbi:MAG: Gfo/Idh/MocA family oxidoreductase [Candidatus Bathyarchaeia archaeon]
MGKIGLGVVGCGWAARDLYEPAFRFLRSGRIVAVMDIDELKAKALSEVYAVPRYYTDLDKMLSDREVEAVVVLTPPHTHPEIVVRAAEAGRHVYCEKPMATTVQEADRMIDACRRNNVKLMVAYMKRFNKSFRFIKDLVDSGQLGGIFELRERWDNVRVFPPPVRRPPRQERTDYRLRLISGGGFLQEDGSHPLDVARWWLGDVEEVNAYVMIVDPERYETENVACVTMRHKSGAVTTLHITMITHTKGEESYELFGTKGTLTMRWLYHSSKSLEPAIIHLHRNGREIQDLTLSVWETRWNPLLDLRENWQYLRELEHFCECILKDEEPYCTGEDGRAVVEIINAAYLSAWRCERVKLPLKETPSLRDFFVELRSKSPWSLGEAEWSSWY